MWPPEIQDRSVWYGSDLAERNDWAERLSDAEIGEVERACRELEKSQIEIATISAKDVPLPTLAPRLRQLLDEVLNGRGFVLIRGLPVERWTKREAAIAFVVIGTHLGNLRMQNAEGHLLGHVRDLGRSSDDPNTRIYQTRERQTHHTDSCDVVGLMCLRTAKSGGLSSLVSSTTIFNEMRRRRPDLLRVLMEPIETDRRGEVPAGGKPYFNIPVFNYHCGLVSAIYQRQYIESARRFPDVPPLTPLQIEALDQLNKPPNDQHQTLRLNLKPATFSSYTITPFCTTAPRSRITLSRIANVTYCAYGSRLPARVRCRKFTQSDTVRSRPGVEAVLWYPELRPPFPSSRAHSGQPH